MAKGYLAMALAVLLGLGASWSAAQTPNDTGKPIGKWTRKTGRTQVVLEIEDGRLHVHLNGEKALVLHADYSITKDRTVYGVVTSVENEEDSEDADHDLVDQPFSCRFRVDEGVLIVRDLKFAPVIDWKDNPWSGRFRAVEAEKPHAPATPVVPLQNTTSHTATPASSTSNGTSLPGGNYTWGITR